MTKNDMELLYDKYSGSVYRLAVSYCKNTADAEDIVQEVFMKLFSADMDFPDERSEKAWIITVTANKCRDMLRSLADTNP
jgi:RNA polymerase sigma-70 factor (ECF subfamily)